MLSKQQRKAGMAFMALGAYVIYYTLTELKIGTVRSPGSGFFTFICGLGIFLMSSALVGISFVKGTKPASLWGSGEWQKPLLAFAFTVLYALCIPRLGFILATVLFLVLWQKLVEKQTTPKTALVAILGSGAMWAVFEKLLRVPLPNGLLPW